MEDSNQSQFTVPPSVHPVTPSEQSLTRSNIHHHAIDDDDPLRPLRQKQREEELKNRSLYGIFFWLTCIVTFIFLIFVAIFLHYIIAIVLCISLLSPICIILLLLIFQKRSKSKIETMMEAYATGVCGVLLIVLLQGIFLFCMGALLGVLGLAIVLNSEKALTDPVAWFTSFFSSIPLSIKILSAFIDAFLVASFFEETMKWFLVRRLKRRDATAFEQYPFAVISYAACASVGFATMENMGYIISFCLPLLSQASSFGAIFWTGMVVVVGRGLTAVPMHVITGSLIGCSLAKYFIFENHVQTPFIVQYLSTIWFPVLIHGSYDFFVFLADMLEAPYNLICFALAMFVLLFSLIVLILQWRSVYTKLYSTKDGIEQRPLMNEEHFVAEEDELYV